LDINQDPSAIASADQELPMSTQLFGIESEWALINHGELVSNSQFWMCMRSYDGSLLAVERFYVDHADVNGFWAPYVGTLRDANSLYNFAKSQKDTCYQSIAGIIIAQNWAFLTDCFGDIPCSEAFKYPTILKPKFDTQAEVYATVFNYLDEAITLLSDLKYSTVGADDYIYKGDMSKWLKLAYSMRARYNMRLSYAPSHTTTAQADLVLADLTNGISSSDDEAIFVHVAGTKSRGYYAYLQESDYSSGLVASPYIIDQLETLNDPRLPIYFQTDAMGGYSGWIQGMSSGTTNKPSLANYNRITDMYPETFMNFREVLFLKAEAYVLKSDFVNAEDAFQDAVTYSMKAEGVSDADIATYLAQFTFPSNVEQAQELVINQKYLAAYLTNTEPLFDYLRTGYPNFGDFTQYMLDPYNTNTCPVRLPYPLIEMDRNPENVPTVANIFTSKLWWDTKP